MGSTSWKLSLLVLAVVITPLLLYYKSYVASNRGYSRSLPVKVGGRRGSVLKMSTLDVLAEDIPEGIDGVKAVKGYVEVAGYKVFYQDFTLPRGSTPPTQQVLLLHGQSFTSKNWLDLGTLTLLASLGHRAVAIDLPGYGKSVPSPPVSDSLEFMENLIKVLKLGPTPVIISPSMSGKFSLPYLVSHPNRVKGYVPVAPGNTESYIEEFPSIKVPTVIVVGELDRGNGPVSVTNLSLLPNHSLLTLPKARHPAYLDQPQLWHKMLYNFLKAL